MNKIFLLLKKWLPNMAWMIWEIPPMQHSGFFAMGDAKGLAKLYDAQGQELILVSQNQDSLHVFTKREETPNSGKIVSLKPMDAWAELHLNNGKASSS